MNNHISDVELAGKGIDICLLWQGAETYSTKHTALFGVLAFMPINTPVYDDIKFLFNYCRSVNHV